MSIPLRRRSKVDRRHLRISFPNHFEAEGARRCAYLVRMIKPNLIVSHDWHIQPSCQRSFRTVRLSGALLDRGLPLRTGVLELNALLVFSLVYVRQHFCANLLKVSNFPLHVNANPELLRWFALQGTHCAKYQRTTSKKYSCR